MSLRALRSPFFLIKMYVTLQRLGPINKDTELSEIGLRFSRNEKNILRIEYIKESASDFKSHKVVTDFMNKKNKPTNYDVIVSNNNSIGETSDSDWDEPVNKEHKMPPLEGPFPL